MNCQQIDEYLFAYCDEKLSPELRSLIDEHLDGCEICQNMVRITRMENQILTDAADIPLLSEDFSGQVMRSIFDQPSTPAGASSAGLLARLSRYRLYIGGTAAAAVILLALYLPGFITLDMNLESSNMADRSVPAGESTADQTTQIPLPGAKALENSDHSSASNTQDEFSAVDKLLTADNTGEDRQKMAPEIDGNDSYTSSTVKQNDQYYTLTLPEGSEIIDQDLNESELDLLSMHPNNLPAEYKMEKIINTSCNVITYVYRNTATDHALEITIALQEDAGSTQRSLLVTGGLGDDPDQEYLRSDAGVLNSTNTSISRQGRSFEINLKAVMPLDKLQELANSIDFEEGLPYEPVD